MFDFFAMAIAVVALIVARKTFNQAAILRARLDAIEATGFQAAARCRSCASAWCWWRSAGSTNRYSSAGGQRRHPTASCPAVDAGWLPEGWPPRSLA
jgi:hypothetical protein